MNVKMSTRLVSKTLVKVKGRVEFTCLGKLDEYRKLIYFVPLLDPLNEQK